MKSFSQFLNESYIREEESVQGRLLNRKNQAYKDINNPNPGNRGYATDPTPTSASRRLPAGAPEGAKTSPGQLEIPEPKTTKVSGSQFRNAGEARQGSLFTKSGGAQNFTKAGKGRVPFTSSEPVKATKRFPAAAPEAPKVSPGQMDIDFNAKPNKGAPLALRTGSNPGIPDAMMRGAQDAANKPPATPKPPASTPSSTPKPSSSAGKPPALSSSSSTSARWKAALEKQRKAAAGSGSSGKTIITPASSGVKSPKSPEAPKVPGKLGKFGKVLGPVSTAVDTALSTADERAKGSGWARSLAKGATVAAGGLLGGTAGAIGGGGLLSAATGTAGAMAGGAAAEKAFDVAAGANAKERKAMATANRQKQAGTAIKGIGGQTTFSQKKPGGPAFMSTGSGSQRKTVQLAKTGVVQRGGQSVAGNLAFKDGKAVYKAGPSAQSLAKTSSNPLERIGRSLFAGAYKKSDAAAAAKKLATARQSDAARNKALGVKFKPAG